MPLCGCGGRNDDSMGEAGFERNVEHTVTRSRSLTDWCGCAAGTKGIGNFYGGIAVNCN